MTTVYRKGEWLTAAVGDDVLMMSPEHENYVGLNTVGAFIWDLLEVPRRFDDICAAIVAEFEVELDQAGADAKTFLGELEKIDAIALAPAETA